MSAETGGLECIAACGLESTECSGLENTEASKLEFTGKGLGMPAVRANVMGGFATLYTNLL